MKLSATEFETAKIIWEREPMPSGELVKLCLEYFNWKKSTTYTVLKKLCSLGIFNNSNSIITSIITRKEYEQIQAQHFIDDKFQGSLPNFLTAFIDGKKLSSKELDELTIIIRNSREV